VSGTHAAVGLLVLAALAVAPGRSAQAHGSFHARIAQADARVALAPDDPEAWLERAVLYRLHGDGERAWADLERAAALAPGRRDVAFERALVLLDAERFAEADAILAGLLGPGLGQPRAHVARARALAGLGDWAGAADELGKAIESQPVPIPDLHLEHARALARAHPGDPDPALHSLDRALAALGPVVALEQEALTLELEAARYDAALARLDRLAARSARPESWLVRRGDVLERAGRHLEARAAYSAALDAIDRLTPQQRAVPALVALDERARRGAVGADLAGAP
jgi:tetratricopeptide (TPR) repeat protein